MRFLHVPSMYWRCECVCDICTPRPGLLRVKKTRMMTKFEQDRCVLCGISMGLCHYLPKRVHHIGEFDIPKARILIAKGFQISLDIILSCGCPQSSSPFRQMIYQLVIVNEYFMASFGRPSSRESFGFSRL